MPSAPLVALSGFENYVQGTTEKELQEWEDNLPEGTQVAALLHTSRILSYQEMGYIGEALKDQGLVIHSLARGEDLNDLWVTGEKWLPFLIPLIAALGIAGVSIWGWESWFKEPTQAAMSWIPILIIAGAGFFIWTWLRPKPYSGGVIIVD